MRVQQLYSVDKAKRGNALSLGFVLTLSVGLSNQVRAQDSAWTQFEYDARNHITAMTDPNGLKTTL